MVLGPAPRAAKRRHAFEAQLLKSNLLNAVRQSAHEVNHGGHGDDRVQLGVVDDVLQLVRFEQVVQGHDGPPEHPRADHGHRKQPGGRQHEANMWGVGGALDRAGYMQSANIEFIRAPCALVINGRHPPGGEDESSND